MGADRNSASKPCTASSPATPPDFLREKPTAQVGFSRKNEGRSEVADLDPFCELLDRRCVTRREAVARDVERAGGGRERQPFADGQALATRNREAAVIAS